MVATVVIIVALDAWNRTGVSESMNETVIRERERAVGSLT